MITCCPLCHQERSYLPAAVGACAECLQARYREARSHIEAVQVASRAEFGLPVAPPRHPNGIQCVMCSNECAIGEGLRGFCGLRTVREGRLV